MNAAQGLRAAAFECGYPARCWHDYAALVYEAFRSTPSLAEMRARVAMSNINKETLLATDYLNHFNEIAMLLEMLPDMPEVMADVRAWTPRSYKDHFRNCTFSDRELAVDAYDCVPSAFFVAFEDTVAETDKLILGSIPALASALETGDRNVVALATELTCQQIEDLMSRLRSIVNGEFGTLGQGEIDSLLLAPVPTTGNRGRQPIPDEDRRGLHQGEIDALFD